MLFIATGSVDMNVETLTPALLCLPSEIDAVSVADGFNWVYPANEKTFPPSCLPAFATFACTG